MVLEAGKGKAVKRRAGGCGRKTGRSTKGNGEKNQDCEQKATNKNPERTEENKRKPDTGKVDKPSWVHFFHITGGRKHFGYLCSPSFPPFFPVFLLSLLAFLPSFLFLRIKLSVIHRL